MQSFRERFEQQAAIRPLLLNPELTDRGLYLGAGTLVLASPQDDSDDRLTALLGVAYKRSFRRDVVANLKKAARQWKRGDKAMARMHLALANLPRLVRREDAFDLFWADELMRAGTEPGAFLKVIALNPRLLDLRKFNPDQPRVPAGNGRESGRWGSGGGSTTPTREEDASPVITGRSAATVAFDKDQMTRNKIAIIGQKYLGSMDWAQETTNGNFPSGKDKCNQFVADVLTAAGASPGEPNHGGWPFYAKYPPTAGQWADPNYDIPGWDVLGSDDNPQPGDVVAQQIKYIGASGHVMIVGPGGTVIGTGDSGPGPEGTIEMIPMPDKLGPRPLGPLVFRRWHAR